MGLDLSSLSDISALIRAQDTGKGIREVKVDAIQPDPNQPRKTFDEEALSELAASIQSVGIIQPPVTRTCDGGYILISGERRWRAARQLGLEMIEVIVRDDLGARAQLVENIQREALSAWEIYRVIAGELDAGTTQADLARALGKSRAWVTAHAAIGKMPERLVTALREKRIAGVTDLGQLHRLLEEAPAVAEALLNAPGHLNRSMIEKARREVSAQRSSPPTTAVPASESNVAKVTEQSSRPRIRIDAGEQSVQPPSLRSERQYLPVRIRVRYENACWIVNYAERAEQDGTLCLVPEDGDGGSCFAPIDAMRLQSVECD
jgi:ParB family chromosome partitioning protein